MLNGVLATLLIVAGAASGGSEAQDGARNLGTTGGDPDQMICRQAEPVLGSRVARRRICRTRAQWQAFEADRAQMRRDIQNAAKDATIEQ